MAHKRHTSARGQEINFDQLQHTNQKALAVGNANVNARGDKIGPGGKIVQTVEERAAIQATQNPAYNQDNPNAVRMVSIKDNVDMATAYDNAVTAEDLSEIRTPEEAVEALKEEIVAKKETIIKKERKIVDKED